MEHIFFARLTGDAVLPHKRREDAGYDVHIRLDEDFLRLEPHETRLLPTGIASACSPNYYFQLQERGSSGTKGIALRCGVIDSGYRGEWFIPVTNLNTCPLYFAKPHMQAHFEELAKEKRCIVYYISKAVCQAILLPVPETEVTEVSYDELLKMESARMTGRLGSSEQS